MQLWKRLVRLAELWSRYHGVDSSHRPHTNGENRPWVRSHVSAHQQVRLLHVRQHESARNRSGEDELGGFCQQCCHEFGNWFFLVSKSFLNLTFNVGRVQSPTAVSLQYQLAVSQHLHVATLCPPVRHECRQLQHLRRRDEEEGKHYNDTLVVIEEHRR